MHDVFPLDPCCIMFKKFLLSKQSSFSLLTLQMFVILAHSLRQFPCHFYEIGITFALFHSIATDLSESDFLNSFPNGPYKATAHSLSMQDEIGSGPYLIWDQFLYVSNYILSNDFNAFLGLPCLEQLMIVLWGRGVCF